MDTGARIAAAAASGYILGRTKKLKLAIAVGSMLAGKRLATDPRGMLRQANELVESRPELARLSEQARTTLLTAARGAAVGVVSQRIDRLSDSIRDRSERLTGQVGERAGIAESDEEDESPARGDEQADEGADEQAGEGADEEVDEGADQGADEQEEEPAESRPRKRAAKKAPAKKAPAKKAPAKKAASRESGSTAKRAATKKSTSRTRSRSAGSKG